MTKEWLCARIAISEDGEANAASHRGSRLIVFHLPPGIRAHAGAAPVRERTPETGSRITGSRACRIVRSLGSRKAALGRAAKRGSILDRNWFNDGDSNTLTHLRILLFFVIFRGKTAVPLVGFPEDSGRSCFAVPRSTSTLRSTPVSSGHVAARKLERRRDNGLCGDSRGRTQRDSLEVRETEGARRFSQ